jgi:anthranilate phosphoribosyltransferase
MSGLKPFIAKIATRQPLTRQEASDAFEILMSGEASMAQVGGFLMGLRVRGETVDEIAGAVSIMRQKMVPVDAPDDAIDIVGTGGDGTNTYNISTLAALIVAGAGVPVAKHGNRALSSKSGTADALSQLGVKLDIEPDMISRCIREAGIGFMFAQLHHPAMRHVGPARVELGARTIFNIVGPLSSPARVKKQLFGVYSPEWLIPGAEALRDLGLTSAWVVHGSGLDEITTTGPSQVAELKDGEIRSFELTPDDFGVETVSHPRWRRRCERSSTSRRSRRGKDALSRCRSLQCSRIADRRRQGQGRHGGHASRQPVARHGQCRACT